MGGFTFIDLFAGVGGFRLGMESAGGECVFTSEWNGYAAATYKANFGCGVHGDITKPDTKESIPQYFDVLCAGFPCQPFSIAGAQKGFADTRGTLFFDIEQIIAGHRPKAVLLENVKNLVSHDGGNTFKSILQIIEEKLGYKAFWQVLNTATHTSIPQNRERVFIACFDPEQCENYKDFKFPDPVQTEIRLKISDMLDCAPDQTLYYIEGTAVHGNMAAAGMKPNIVYQWRRTYARENKSNVCPTLTANMGAGGHNVPIIMDGNGIRKLSPRECFRLQGFPESFILPNMPNSRLYMQAGNSVTVPLISKIAERMASIIIPERAKTAQNSI